jgi:serine O-acetyltransferase
MIMTTGSGQTKPSRLVRSDLYRHGGLSGFRGFCKGLLQPGFRYSFLFRLMAARKTSSPLSFFLRVMLRRYRFKYGFEINPQARIGAGFHLTDHCGPVVIGPVRIGKLCTIAHNVTIGRTYDPQGGIGRPTLGDRVWVGAGAVLVGPITIGSDVLVAPNAFVNFDVPDHSLVIGNPGRVVPRPDPTRFYIDFALPEPDSSSPIRSGASGPDRTKPF